MLSWTFTFNILTEPCSVWDIALGFCSVSELCMDIGVDLLEHPYLGRLWHCLNTHLNASIQQNAKASAFIQASPPAGYHLYNKITVYSENIPLFFLYENKLEQSFFLKPLIRADFSKVIYPNSLQVCCYLLYIGRLNYLDSLTPTLKGLENYKTLSS